MVAGSVSAKTGNALFAEDRVVGGDEREGRADDLIARIEARDVQGGDQRRGAAGRGQAALRAEQLGIGRLELGHFSAAAATIPLPTTEHFENLRFPRLPPFGPGRPAARMHRRAAEQGGLVGCVNGARHRQSHTGCRCRGDEIASIDRSAHVESSNDFTASPARRSCPRSSSAGPCRRHAP